MDLVSALKRCEMLDPKQEIMCKLTNFLAVGDKSKAGEKSKGSRAEE